MSSLQKLVVSILPKKWAASVESESRTWIIRCSSCGLERSVWEAGGIRWKAAGTARRYLLCPKWSSQKTFLHMQWSTDRAINWIDPSTLTIYSSLAMRVHRQDGEDVGEGFGADVLFTIKLDAAGKMEDYQNASDVGERSREV